MSTTKEIYESAIRPLPPRERLNLAALILSDLTQPDSPEIDYSDSWSEEDIRDLTNFVVAEAEKAYPEEDDLV